MIYEKVLNNKLKYAFFASIMLFLTILLFSTKSVSAAPVAENYPTGGAMPASIRSYLLDCGGTNNGVAQISWLSVAGDPDATVIDVPSGQTSVTLQYNVAMIVCRAGILGGLQTTNNGIITTSPNTPSLNNVQLAYAYAVDAEGYWATNQTTFTYTAPTGGFVTSGYYRLEVSDKRIHRYSISSTFRCVGNPGSPSNQSDFGSCPSSGFSGFDFYLNVFLPQNWEYKHEAFTASSTGSSSPYPRVDYGSTVNLAGTVKNDGDGTGANYVYTFQQNAGGDSWSAIQNSSGAGLGGGATSSSFSSSYTLPTTLSNDTEVCFRAIIEPFQGVSTPSLTITSTGARAGPVRCVRVYNAPVSVAISGIPSCSTLNYQITDDDAGAVITVVLIVDGVEQSGVYRKTGQSPGNGDFSIESWVDVRQHNFQVKAIDTEAGGREVTTDIVTTATACTTLTCSYLTPTAVWLGEPFNATFAFELSQSLGGSIPAYTYSTKLDFAGFYNGPMYVSQTVEDASTLSGSISSASARGPFFMYKRGIVATTTGTFAARAGLSGITSAPFTCGDYEVQVRSKPYVRFYGNDVFAGGSYGSTCVAAGSANAEANGLFVNNTNSHANYKGSASELAVFATGRIQGVLPGSQNISWVSTSALSFANTAAATGPLEFGGGFGSALCADEFPDASDFDALTSNTLTGLDGNYFADRSIVLAASSVLVGSQVTLVVDGDVTIQGDILYEGVTGGWGTEIENIPLLRLYATGKITIDGSVSALNGLYATKDTINTCSTAVATCGNKLTVIGAFIAQRVNLNRTVGNVAYASDIPEPYTSTNIAEVFRFSPEFYLALLSVNQDEYGGRFDSILSLPPAL